MTRVYISADLEGVSGVVHGSQLNEGTEYEAARRLMTEEVNAAIAGALDAGASEIVVNDSHGSMRNLLPDRLNPAALLITGTPKPLSMVEGVQDGEYRCAMFVGYHAGMGCLGVLSHTYSGSRVRNVKVNGINMGETGINAAVAGAFNIPVALITGDDRVCAEASELLPGIITADVKQARGRYVARGLHPEKARELIRKQAKLAVERAGEMEPLRLSEPVALELEFLNSGQAEGGALLPGVRMLNPTTLEFRGDSLLQAFAMLRALINLG
ncbi:MAG: peptidase M55 [Firmicutes bacterium]|nr:peptidase M55 [Bacillota bacterium]